MEQHIGIILVSIDVSKNTIKILSKKEKDDSFGLLQFSDYTGGYSNDEAPYLRTLINNSESINSSVNKLVFFNNGYYLFTEYSGFYQLFKYSSTNNNIYLSTRLDLLVELADSLTLQHQECIEYLNISTTLGNKTIFKEIEKLPPGVIYDISNDTTRKISNFNKIFNNTNKIESLIDEYFTKFINSTNKDIYCDLSGGYDTRTVASVLLNKKGIKGFLTNNRSKKITSDLEVSLQLAKETKIPIEIIDIEPELIDYDSIQSFKDIDYIRGLDISFRLITEIKNKAQKQGIVIGGWGAELLRGLHSKNNDIDSISKSFEYCRIDLPSEIYRKYMETIKLKIISELEYFEIEKNHPKLGELVHYFVKARHWAGSMLTLRNNYLPTFFPLYDPVLAIPILMSDKVPKLQTDLINAFAPELKNIPFSSGDKPIGNRLKVRILVYSNKLIRRLKKISVVGSIFNSLNQSMDYSFPANHFTDNKNFSEFMGVSMTYLKAKSPASIPRYIGLMQLLRSNPKIKLES